MTKIINKRTKKPIEMDDFVFAIPWEEIQDNMYAKDYKRFLKWMGGQTTSKYGVWGEDLHRFINGGDSFRC